jgi:hypothetical protein
VLSGEATNTDSKVFSDPRSGFADGLWHKFSLLLNDEKFEITIDKNTKSSVRTMVIESGTRYFLGKQ